MDFEMVQEENSEKVSTQFDSLMLDKNVSLHQSRKYLVFEDNLLIFLRLCPKYGANMGDINTITNNYFLVINYLCENVHYDSWHSLPSTRNNKKYDCRKLLISAFTNFFIAL